MPVDNVSSDLAIGGHSLDESQLFANLVPSDHAHDTTLLDICMICCMSVTVAHPRAKLHGSRCSIGLKSAPAGICLWCAHRQSAQQQPAFQTLSVLSQDRLALQNPGTHICLGTNLEHV